MKILTYVLVLNKYVILLNLKIHKNLVIHETFEWVFLSYYFFHLVED